MDYCMITFSGTHAAVSAQKLLEPLCPFQAMPVLREVSKGCGIALRFPPEYLSRVHKALAHSPLPAEEYAFYAITGGGKNLHAEPLSGEHHNV